MPFRTSVVAALAAALSLSPVSGRAQTTPAACAETVPPGYVLVSPADSAPAIAVDFKTIYIANLALPTAASPPVKQTRVLLLDDAGAVTEGGVLSDTTRDDLPYALQGFQPPVAGATPAVTFAYTWIPGLRASTHYTVALARLDENDCTFARLGGFTTRPY